MPEEVTLKDEETRRNSEGDRKLFNIEQHAHRARKTSTNSLRARMVLVLPHDFQHQQNGWYCTSINTCSKRLKRDVKVRLGKISHVTECV